MNKNEWLKSGKSATTLKGIVSHCGIHYNTALYTL